MPSLVVLQRAACTAPAHLERELVEVPLPRLVGDAALVHQPPQVAVGADVVEAVVVDADVRQVRGHHGDGPLAAEPQEALVAGRVELQQGRAELEALRPLGPALGRVAALRP